MGPKRTVKAGYDRIAADYRAARPRDSEDVQLLRLLVERLPNGARVLDAGCGSGTPVSQFLAQFLEVTGVDFATEQVRMAKETLPNTPFICADIANLPFPDSTFDAVCSYYAIIHIPRDEHRELLLNFHRILKPGGLALLCMGAGDLPEDLSDYHGVRMYWSHYDGETNMRLLRESRFDIHWSRTIVDSTNPPSSHLFVLGQKHVKPSYAP